MCISFVEIPYNIQSLYAGLDVTETSFVVRTSFKGFSLVVVVRLGLVGVLDCEAELTGRTAAKDPVCWRLVQMMRHSRYCTESALMVAHAAPMVGEQRYRVHSRESSHLLDFLICAIVSLRLRNMCLSSGVGRTWVSVTANLFIMIARWLILIFWSLTSRWLLHTGLANSRQVRELRIC